MSSDAPTLSTDVIQDGTGAADVAPDGATAVIQDGAGEPGLDSASGDDGELGTRAAASGEPGLDSASGDDGELGTRAAASGEPGRDSASGDNEGDHDRPELQHCAVPARPPRGVILVRHPRSSPGKGSGQGGGMEDARNLKTFPLLLRAPTNPPRRATEYLEGAKFHLGSENSF